MDDNREDPSVPPSSATPSRASYMQPTEFRPVNRSRLPAMLVVLGTLIFLLILPQIAEKIVEGITRGREKAQAEVAADLLSKLPNAPERLPYVIKKVEPSVVAVETVQIGGRGSPNDEWARLFGQPNVRGGIGSGVIMDAAGYIVTNHHVIDRAAQLSVTLADGRNVPATIVGADPTSDLAVLKIDASNLTAAGWGDSDKLQVGDQVLAIGSPFGLSQTVTSGIVSAKDRRGMDETHRYRDFLQTDAAVNPGNSGGPLVNMKGEVVGINTAIVGPTYQGISFAIPSRVAQDIYDRLRTSGKIIARGYLGVSLADVNEAIAQRLGVQEMRGAFVANVMPGSPAEKAGIQRGDLILQWGKTPIDTATDLSLLVMRSEIGTKATVTVLRDGNKLELPVTVGERPGRAQE